MKLHVIAMAALFGLSGSALAQTSAPDNESTLNGATLGKSMPGSNAGVPYRSSATAAPGMGAPRPHGMVRRKHHRQHPRM